MPDTCLWGEGKTRSIPVKNKIPALWRLHLNRGKTESKQLPYFRRYKQFQELVERRPHWETNIEAKTGRRGRQKLCRHLGKENFKQREQQKQRPWGAHVFKYLTNSKADVVVAKWARRVVGEVRGNRELDEGFSLDMYWPHTCIRLSWKWRTCSFKNLTTFIYKLKYFYEDFFIDF